MLVGSHVKDRVILINNLENAVEQSRDRVRSSGVYAVDTSRTERGGARWWRAFRDGCDMVSSETALAMLVVCQSMSWQV
jgi:hypothetical protein